MSADIVTSIGPYPPSRPKDPRTFIWSRCRGCGWGATHPEESRSMEHCIAVAEHRCDDVVQLDLFGGAA